MITKINKPCVNCGADRPIDFREYDGMLGYEAVICKCGWRYDGVYAPQGEADVLFVEQESGNE